MPVAADKKRVRVAFRKWQKRLVLSEHTFPIEWKNKPRETDDANSITLAYVEWQMPTIEHPTYIYPAFWDSPEDRQEQTVLHELVHVLTQDGDESRAAVITTILWRAYES